MGIVDVSGPPKKKLKQAQLSFCVPSQKTGNKRKLNTESPHEGRLSCKVFCKDPDTVKASTFIKENVSSNTCTNPVITSVDLTEDGTGDGVDLDVSSIAEKVSIREGEGDEKSEVKNNDSIPEKASLKVEVDETLINKETSGSKEEDHLKDCGKTSELSHGKRSLLDNEKLNEGCDSRKVCEGANIGLIEVKSVEDNENQVDLEQADRTLTSENDVQFSEESFIETDITGEIRGVNGEEENERKQECDSSKPNNGKTRLDLSLDSTLDDTSPIYLSSDGENKSSSTAKSSTTPGRRRKHKRSSLLEEKMRLKKERDESNRKKREDKERKREEQLKLKEQRIKQKNDERKQREEAKEEEKKRKEDERKRKEEVKEEEKKRKEEVREEEKKRKEEERRKKEEIKEESRRKKEEVRLAEERKENLAKMAFTKFFIPSTSKTATKEEPDCPSESNKTLTFMPFPVKTDMRLAVQVRHSISREEKCKLDKALDSDVSSAKLYLSELKEGLKLPSKTSATWPLCEEQHDVIIVESVVEDNISQENMKTCQERLKRRRGKLLQFHDNRRPPYWGTWRKKSKNVTPRKPFGRDSVFDYDVNSDDEWEDEGEGEDIDKEVDSDREQSDDDNVGENGYLLDKTFVPHGYLSDEEAAEEENLNPEDQKLKRQFLKQEFEQELKTKTVGLKPRLLGCVWISNDTTEVSKGSLYETLMNYRCNWDEAEGSIDPTWTEMVDCSPLPSSSNAKFPLTMIERLAKFVHGSRLSHKNLVSEFLTSIDKENNLSSVSKRAVTLKIKEIANKLRDSTGPIWEIIPEIRAEYDLPSLTEAKNVPASPTVAVTKSKDSPLVNFFKRASTSPQETKKRIIPTLISPAAQKKSTDIKSTDSNCVQQVSAPTTPRNVPAHKRIVPITLSKKVSQFTDIKIVNSNKSKSAVPNKFPLLVSMDEKGNSQSDSSTIDLCVDSD